MKVELAALKGIFAASPFVAEIGIAPIALEASVRVESDGERTLVMKASATMAVTAAG